MFWQMAIGKLSAEADFGKKNTIRGYSKEFVGSAFGVNILFRFMA